LDGAVHAHGTDVDTAVTVTPAGNVSDTVVVPVVVPGHTLVARSVYVTTLPRDTPTPDADVCASTLLAYFFTIRSKGATGVGITTIYAGSVFFGSFVHAHSFPLGIEPSVLHGLVSFGLCTYAVLRMVPVVAVTRTGTTISGYIAPADTIADVVHTTLCPVIVHVHPAPVGTDVDTIPVGRVSTTVVVPDVLAGPALETRSTYCVPDPDATDTPVVDVCASLVSTYFLILRSNAVGTGVGTTITTAGSVLSVGPLESLLGTLLDTVAVLVYVPGTAIDTGTVIVGYVLFAARPSVRVQVNAPPPTTPVHVHPAPVGTADRVIPAGRESDTVVVPGTTAPDHTLETIIV
jgi:hypothetical protein